MLDENNKFNLPALKEKVDELLAKQDNLLYLLNTPAHNPTGYSLSGEDMDGVLAILKEAAVPGKNIVFFLDVAYIDYAGEKEEVRKIFKKLSGLPANILCIVGYSMSKGFTMYGQRTGAMIGVSSDKSVIDEFAAIKPIHQPCNLVQHQPSGYAHSGNHLQQSRAAGEGLRRA